MELLIFLSCALQQGAAYFNGSPKLKMRKLSIMMLLLMFSYPIFAHAALLDGIYYSADDASYIVKMTDDKTLSLIDNMGLDMPPETFCLKNGEWVQRLSDNDRKLGYTTPWKIEFYAKARMRIKTVLNGEVVMSEFIKK